ncbi:3,4-dihydroxy-2-butanone-4-phosphate synthase [Rikenella microfusus]|uniref:3,4-dihydroxy-2-butanone-4-phosphate synthase n=1 Tax=Rikenella microfusus TaxID=28139 RepID=UPI002353C5DB|nr:3,4-dihydroxy-2-butanone-4-phosphate synthase [Rikenella microfusus]
MERNELLAGYGTSAQRVERAAAALKEGRGILLTDNENRENEGDLIFAASRMTVEQMALTIRACSGIVCLCMPEEKAEMLDLPPMVARNTSRYGTAFTISIEAAEGVTTGVSAADRIRTIRSAIAPEATPASLCRPGHVFPLIARPGGVLERDGHTEGSVDLVRIAGLPPYAVLCELTNEDGTMARLPQVVEFARRHDYPVVTIDDIKTWRQSRESAEPV